MEEFREQLRIQKINRELTDHLVSSIHWLFSYTKKHNIPLPEKDKISNLVDRAIEIMDQELSNETLQPSKKGKTDEDLTAPKVAKDLSKIKFAV